MDKSAKQSYVFHHLTLIDMERVIHSLDRLQKYEDAHTKEALFRDAVVCYAKPFSGNLGMSGKRMENMNQLFVPVQHVASHEEVLKLRNKLFAHVDLDLQAPNVSITTVDGARRIVFSVTGYERVFASHLVEPLRALAQAAHSYCMHQLGVVESAA